MIKDYIEEEGRNILGFDRLNRPVYPGDLVVDALGRRYEVRADGYAYDQNSPAFAALSDLNGPTLEAPLQPQRPAPSEEQLALHAYDDPKLSGPAKDAKPITVVPTRRKPVTGRANLSGLVRVSLIAKAAGYHAGNPTQVLRGEGFEIRTNKTGQPCVLVKDRERAFDVLEAAAAGLAAAKEVGGGPCDSERLEREVEETLQRTGTGCVVNERGGVSFVDYVRGKGVLIHPGNRPGGCLPVGGLDFSGLTPEQEKDGLLKVLKDVRDGKLSATVTVQATDEIQEAVAASEKVGESPAPRVESLQMDATNTLAALTTEDLVQELLRRGWSVTLQVINPQNQ